MTTFHWPVLGLGPLHLEWSAACYERLAARLEAPQPDSWNWGYVGAAYQVEHRLLEDIHHAGLGRNLPWYERKLL